MEQEILRLKPLLLLQPYSNQSKQTMGTQNQTARGKRPDIDASPSKVGPTQKSDHTAFPYGYQYRPEVSLSSGQSFASHTFLLEGPSTSGPSSQQRRSRDHSNTQKVKKQKHYRSTTSDAYAEHVLLAAQRIGRKRAAVVTGRQRLADREQEIFARENDQVTPRKELERLEKDKLASGTSNMTYYRPSEDSGPSSTPNGPKRSGLLYGQRHNANPGGVNTPPPPAYVFVNTSAARMSNSSAYSPGSILKTPSRPDTTIRLSQASNPPTPLDSLVDAARMMGEGGYRTRRRLLEEPESPTAKRRKVSGDKVLVNRGTSRLGHVKSGLDVLADQAAAVIKPQSSAVHLGNDSRTASDGKGKGKATSQTTDTMTTRNSPTKSRGSTRTARPPSRRLFTSHDELPSASSPSVDRGTITPEPRLIALPTAVSSGFVARVGVNLRPVSAWGDPPTPDEDEEDSNSDSMCQSPTQSVLRNETPRVAFSDPNALEENNALVSAVQPASVPLGATHDISDAALNGCDEERDSLERKYTHHIDDSKDATPQASTQSSIQQTLATGRLEVSRSQLVEHPACQPPPQAPTRQASPRGSTECSDDAAGSVFDEDAEGEEDEENTENDADVASRDHPFRSRSPPPPDPPGSDNGPGPSNEQDPDADADGDVDVDGKGTPPPSGTDFATNRNGHHRQTAAFVTETSSTKASYTMPLFFFSLTAMSTHSTGMQRSRLSIHTIVCNVNNRAFPQAIQFIEGWNVMIRDTVCSPLSAAIHIFLINVAILCFIVDLYPRFQVRKCRFSLTRCVSMYVAFLALLSC